MQQEILAMAKEVETTTDSKKAAQLLQSGDWVAISAVDRGEEMMWVLIRVQDTGTGVQVREEVAALLRAMPQRNVV